MNGLKNQYKKPPPRVGVYGQVQVKLKKRKQEIDQGLDLEQEHVDYGYEQGEEEGEDEEEDK